jgi:RHS repeat-associated protein
MSNDPTIGTWIEADPEQYVDGLSRYQAFDSNPARYLDPTGLDPANVEPVP